MSRAREVVRTAQVLGFGAGVPGGARYPRNVLSSSSLDDCRRAQREETHHGANLEPRRAAVREPQQVVVETVLLVPHPVRAGFVHGRGDVAEVLGELSDHVLVGRVVEALEREFQHVQLNRAIHAVPSACSRWPPVGSGALRSNTPMLSRPRKPPSIVLTETVLAVHPPGVVQQKLLECRPEEFDICLATQAWFSSEERRRTCTGGFTSLKFLVAAHLAVRVQVEGPEHQLHLLLGEVGIDDGKWKRVEGQIQAASTELSAWAWR